MDFGAIDTTYGAHLATIDPALDGPIWMVNFMKYKERADYGGTAPRSPGAQRTTGTHPSRCWPRSVPRSPTSATSSTATAPGTVWASSSTRRAVPSSRCSPARLQGQARPQGGRMPSTVIMWPCLPPGARGGRRLGDRALHRRAVGLDTGADRGGRLFEVEGTIIGDDRRWGSLRISWTDGAGETEGADTMVVRSRPHRSDPQPGRRGVGD